MPSCKSSGVTGLMTAPMSGFCVWHIPHSSVRESPASQKLPLGIRGRDIVVSRWRRAIVVRRLANEASDIGLRLVRVRGSAAVSVGFRGCFRGLHTPVHAGWGCGASSECGASP
jgi:hypothetical protein